MNANYKCIDKENTVIKKPNKLNCRNETIQMNCIFS